MICKVLLYALCPSWAKYSKNSFVFFHFTDEETESQVIGKCESTYLGAGCHGDAMCLPLHLLSTLGPRVSPDPAAEGSVPSFHLLLFQGALCFPGAFLAAESTSPPACWPWRMAGKLRANLLEHIPGLLPHARP